MKDKDRLAKAQRKLKEHQNVCKQCEANIYDVTSPQCTIAVHYAHEIDRIKKQMRKK